jgi:dienelactone hydrolase
VIKRSSIVVVLLVFVLTGRGQTTSSPPQNDFIADARAFIELLVNKKFATAVAQFDNTMRAALPEAKLDETWTAVLGQAGPFKQAGSARVEKRDAFMVVVVTCDFQNAALDVSVVFDEQKRVAGLFFAPAKKADYAPPAYEKSDAFREKEATVGAGEWALPATLTIPVGAGPFPALVLVHGSGPNDRDETIGPNKPFKDLAWGLASRGVAVLRYEKRTKQYPAKIVSIPNLTAKEEVVDDALAAVELLRKTEGIDAKRIFVLGHSLGGMFVPRIGRLDPNLAGLITMAGATRALEDVIPEQLTYLFSLDGTVSPDEQKQIDEVKAQAAKVKALKPEDSSPANVIFGVPVSYWLDLRGYDPAESAKALKQPMLVLQGERDYQVTMEDFKKWNTALSGKSNVVFKSYPGLNHLFITGTNRSSPLEYNEPGHVDERVVEDIATWIKKH